jgi:hypothetical protein
MLGGKAKLCLGETKLASVLATLVDKLATEGANVPNVPTGVVGLGAVGNGVVGMEIVLMTGTANGWGRGTGAATGMV